MKKSSSNFWMHLLARVASLVIIAVIVHSQVLDTGRAAAQDTPAAQAANPEDPDGLYSAEEAAGGDGAAAKKPIPQTDFSQVAKSLFSFLPMAHLLRTPFDEAISAKAWTNYISALDYERKFFLQSDIDNFDKYRLTIHTDMMNGHLSFPREAFETFRRRIDERVGYVEKLLETDEPFDYSEDEYLQFKRNDAPWAQTAEELDDIWRKRVKNELLSKKIIAEMAAEETNANSAAQAAIDAPAPGGKPAPGGEKAGVAQNGDAAGAEPLPAEAVAASVAEAGTAAGGAPAGEPRQGDAEAGPGGSEGVASAAPPAPPPPTPKEVILKRNRQFQTIMHDSDTDYVMSRFIDAVTTAYDPHTNYMSPEGEEDFAINMQLSLQGIGAQLQSEDGAAKISEIIPGGPASRDHRDIRLVKGDKIIGVGQGDGEIVDTLHWPLNKTVRLIRGPKGSKVVLLVQSASDPTGATTRYVDLIRDEVKLEDQAASSAVLEYIDHEGNTRKFGYIELPTFYSSGTTRDRAKFRSAAFDIAKLLADLNTKEVEGLIFDLRGNGGGALSEAVDVTGLFIRTGEVVQVRDRYRISRLSDRNPAVAFRKPMVVLIDRASASASEIVAGALKDYGRAIIVGDSRTFGKGTVQQIIGLDMLNHTPGSLKITNASFYRVNGSSTQGKGVESDIVLSSVLDLMSDIGEDKIPNAIPWSQVPRADFSPLQDLAPSVAELSKRSEERRDSSELWQKYAKSLARLKKIYDEKEISLQIDKRRELAREDKAYEDENAKKGEKESERKMYESEDEKAERRARDAVLQESLGILADHIELNGPVSVKHNRTPSSRELFRDFFSN